MTTTLQLGPREAQVYAMFKAKAKRTVSDLRKVYDAEDMLTRNIDKSLSSIIFTLNAKLEAARKGAIVRISARGRGHPGVYQLKRR